ncbi:MAG: DUF3370 domain-containing protein [Leptolyngbyaceae cyanobacterium]
MFNALVWLPLASAMAIAPPPQVASTIAAVPAIEGEALPQIPNEIMRQQEVRPLPGELNNIPVFNSNSPELVQQEGILLSTFPRDQMASDQAHLDFAFDGSFDFFAHHVARGIATNDRRTLFLGGLIYNPNAESVTLEIGQGASYLSQQAPFHSLPALRLNPDGSVFAGPGSRIMTDILQRRRQSQWPRQVVIPAKQAYLLVNAPIPLRRLPFETDATLPPGSILPGAPSQFRSPPVASVSPGGSNLQLPSNGRSLLLQLSSSGPVHAATLAMYAPRNQDGYERAPTLQEWLRLLVNGDLSGPRDIPPTNPEEYAKGDGSSRFYYGRVAGVAQGSRWEAIAVDEPDASRLTIPAVGKALSYVISTVDYNTFGTDQIQSAPMLVRYPDTAYRAHGNYGVHYKVSLPLYNNTDREQRIILRLQTPLQDETLKQGLRFLRNPANRVFFRGTVRVQYATSQGQQRLRDIHVVQHQGEEGEPILRLSLPPGAQQDVVVELVYPPDATPPQVLTITTLGTASGRNVESSTTEELPVAEVAEEADLPATVAPETPTVSATDLLTVPLPTSDRETEAEAADSEGQLTTMEQFVQD